MDSLHPPLLKLPHRMLSIVHSAISAANPGSHSPFHILQHSPIRSMWANKFANVASTLQLWFQFNLKHIPVKSIFTTDGHRATGPGTDDGNLKMLGKVNAGGVPRELAACYLVSNIRKTSLADSFRKSDRKGTNSNWRGLPAGSPTISSNPSQYGIRR